MSSTTPTESAATPADAPRPRKPRYRATVKQITPLTPRMIRVTFAGDELAGFDWNGPAAHIKLIFEAGAARPTTRTYTPRRYDPQSRELDVDFVLHGDGPASTWATQAAIGQDLVIAGPGRSYAVDPSADWYLLAGDDTALPAICTILETLPHSIRACALIEVVDAGEEQALGFGPNVEVTWLHRGPDAGRAGQALEQAVRQTPLAAGSGRVYVACESGAMRRIRSYLLTDLRLDRNQIVTRGYWKLGATDHPDRDYGEDAAL